MNTRTYRTIKGRKLNFDRLIDEERKFLGTVRRKFARRPEWSAFASWWVGEFQRSGLPDDSLAFRIHQDIEARLGIAQGKGVSA